MTDVVRFFIPGKPHGKGRPRFTRMPGGAVRTYTDDKTASYEGLVALAAYRAMGDRDPFDQPVSVYVRVEMEMPGSVVDAERAAMLEGEIEPTTLPDLDNVVKSVLDGCNKVAFIDDKLVTHVHAVKVYAAVPGVHVSITRSTGLTRAAWAIARRAVRAIKSLSA